MLGTGAVTTAPCAAPTAMLAARLTRPASITTAHPRIHPILPLFQTPPLSTHRYTEALALCPPPDRTQQRRSLLSNRSRAALEAGRAADALSDADAAVGIAPNWAKGHWRRGRALGALGRLVLWRCCGWGWVGGRVGWGGGGEKEQCG